MNRTRPWYGFLYYLLGAQGSFFAWVIALFGVYVTGQEALLFAVNQAPRPSTIAGVFQDEPRWRRWVEVRGVEIDLASPLFPRGPGAPAGGGMRNDRILIDPDEPTALAWREVFREIATVSDKLEGAAGGAADSDLIRVSHLLFRIGAPETRAQYIPGRALLVVGREAPEAATRAADAGAGAEGPSDERERWRRNMRAKIYLIRSAVNPDALRTGFLEPLPERRRAAYKDTYELTIASAALGLGHRPSTVAAGLFAACAATLLFLAVGLRAGGGAP